MYVLAYGLGPMIFSPLSEIPSFGRLNVYMTTFLIFVILQIPTALAPNFETLIAMRFFAGLVCSPALSTGGATLADVFSPMSQPYVVALWAAGAVAGPVTGPVSSAPGMQSISLTSMCRSQEVMQHKRRTGGGQCTCSFSSRSSP